MIRRRSFLTRALAAVGLSGVAACESLSRSDRFAGMLGTAEGLTRRAQRLLTARDALAREFDERDLSAVFPTNGHISPRDPAYHALARAAFRDWRLEVGGMVEQPIALSIEQIRRLPARTQITRHDCVEGWSAIGKWTGVQVHRIMKMVRPLPAARYAVFFCADADASGAYYYESLDQRDAAHPQTLLAYELNGEPLPIANGAPLRLRVERQLGYKMAKYLMRIEFRDTLQDIGGGRGGYWEDRGYEWYAGI